MLWEDGSLRFDHIPFVVVNHKVYDCQHGVDRRHEDRRHEQHCMYSCLLFGSLKRQKIGTEFLLQDRWQCTLLLVLGKGFIFPDSRQLTKCWRISNWLYLCVAGSKPWHKSVAKANAMRPQSLRPSCFCTFSLQNITVSC